MVQKAVPQQIYENKHGACPVHRNHKVEGQDLAKDYLMIYLPVLAAITSAFARTSGNVLSKMA